MIRVSDTSHKRRRINISEGFDVNKTSAWKEYDIWMCILKILVLSIAISLQWLSWFNAKSYELFLLLFMSKEVLTEFGFGIWVKMMQLT